MDIRHAVGVRSGTPAEALADIARYRESARFTARERAALEFSERITRDDLEVSDGCHARLREHFSDAEIVELTFIIGYQTFASKFAKAFRLPPAGIFGAPGGRRTGSIARTPARRLTGPPGSAAGWSASRPTAGPARAPPAAPTQGSAPHS